MGERPSIRSLRPDEDLPWDLLLDADPSREMIETYINDCELFVIDEDGGIFGVITILQLGPTVWDIKNVSVDEAHRHKGFGRALIEHAWRWAREQGCITIYIRTANASIDQFALYQKMGFRMTQIDRDYFLTHPYEEIWRDGIRAFDLVKLEKRL